jgi:predicted secreted hydrolase
MFKIRGRLIIRLFALMFFIFSFAGCSPDSFYEIFTDEPVVRLPQDESPHSSGGEWWYYTGMLNSVEGKVFGVEAVVFHAAGKRVGLPMIDVWISHYAVLDQEAKAYAYDQCGYFQWLYQGSDSEGFDLYTPLVQMQGFNGQDHITAATTEGNYALELNLIDERGVVLHGSGGYVPYGDLYSFYYSRPIMQAKGTLVVDGQTMEVQGEMWFDRQWGRDVINPWLKWDWFSLRLNDGSSVMLFAFRETDPVLYEGTYIPPAGDAINLTSEDFTITPTGWWTSERTDVSYPVAWTINIPSQGLTLNVKAVVDYQEFNARSTSANIYWEGLCTIEGTRNGEPISGSAYIELTNY